MNQFLFALLVLLCCYFTISSDSGGSETQRDGEQTQVAIKSPIIARRTANAARATIGSPDHGRKLSYRRGIHPSSINKFHQLNHQIYSGGQPVGNKAFVELAKRNIKTIVSVDGAKPDVEAAGRHGLRYVHIPIGYGTVSEHAQLSLVKLVREVEGPYYFHCHRGQHRGPVAAAIAGLASEKIDQHAAQAFLMRAGTGREYAGLWQAVHRYKQPPKDAVYPKLVAAAKTKSLATAMANIDQAFEKLQGFQRNNWKNLAAEDDRGPRQHALLLKEGLFESRRIRGKEYSPPFAKWLADSELQAKKLESSLVADHLKAASTAFHLLSQSCTRCHERFRDGGDVTVRAGSQILLLDTETNGNKQ